jgi:hypothetical protein
MTVNELKNLLDEMAEDGRGECEVLFVYQESYPLQDHIADGWIPATDDEDEADAIDDQVVYLVSGGQVYDNPYGPSRAFDEAVKTL